MNIDFTDYRILLSILFIFFGSTVFYVASLISGHNIYRDVGFRISSFITSIIGFFIFLFSPICFVVLFPSLFHVDNVTGSITPEYIEKIHDIIINETLMPYLFSAVGFGIAIGCLSSIEIRPLILHDFRRRIGIDFPIRTYGFAWDSFLYDIKKNGKIKVNLQNDTGIKSDHWYQLVGFSIKSEPRELLLKKINDNDSFDILTSNIESIKEIHVPPESFKKNYRTETPSSFALHLALASIGFLLLFESFHMTSDLLKKLHYESLSGLYLGGGFFFLVIALISICASWKFLVSDYKHKESAFILCYFPSLIVIVNLAIIVGVINHIFCLEWLDIFITNVIIFINTVFESSFSKIIGVLLLIALVVQYQKYREFKGILNTTLNGKLKYPQEKQELLKDLESVILSFDENDPFAELNRDNKNVTNILEKLKDESPLPYFLKDEKEIQLIKSCFWYLKNHD